MLVDVLLFCAGLALLLAGGEGLVRGSAALARRLGISPIIVGLTTVAFGTSAPELAVSLFAASSGNPGIAFGNVVGSNVANIGLLLGITAIIGPLTVHSQVIVREIPMMLLACAVVFALGVDEILGEGGNLVQRGDGAVLLLLFGVFLFYTARDALGQRKRDRLLVEASGAPALVPQPGLATAIVLVVVGLTALVLGGRLLVDSAVAMARSFGMPEIVIGVTIVAVGTSLPELTTCILAVRKGMNDLAVGNIVGSNIFNLLLVLGLTSTVHPVPVPDGGWIDLAFMSGFSLALLPITITHQRSITRLEGAGLLLGYLVYAAWQLVR